MSVNTNIAGYIEETLPVVLANTNTTDIYTVDANDRYVVLAGFSLANVNGGAVTCECYHYRALNTTAYLLYVEAVSDDTTTLVSDIPRRMLPGDKFQVKGNANVTVTPVIVRSFANEPADNRYGLIPGR